MIDQTIIEIVSKDLEKVANTIANQPTGLSSGEVALIAAFIGALSAILAQLIIFFLNRHKEKSSAKNEMVAEERKISYLLSEYYKELVIQIVHKQYWFRLSKIINDERSAKFHERHSLSNEESFQTMTKIRLTTAEYFKTITLFTNIAGNNEVINDTIKKIKGFQPETPTDFENISNWGDLFSAQEEEIKKLSKNLLFYSDCFDLINIEMIKKI